MAFSLLEEMKRFIRNTSWTYECRITRLMVADYSSFKNLKIVGCTLLKLSEKINCVPDFQITFLTFAVIVDQVILAYIAVNFPLSLKKRAEYSTVVDLQLLSDHKRQPSVSIRKISFKLASLSSLLVNIRLTIPFIYEAIMFMICYGDN